MCLVMNFDNCIKPFESYYQYYQRYRSKKIIKNWTNNWGSERNGLKETFNTKEDRISPCYQVIK